MSEPTETPFHVISPMTYFAVCCALLVLTAANTALSYINLGIFNTVLALAIACSQATLVVLFFMHIRYSSRLTMLTVVAGFFTFLILITLTMTDYASRAWGRW